MRALASQFVQSSPWQRVALLIAAKAAQRRAQRFAQSLSPTQTALAGLAWAWISRR